MTKHTIKNIIEDFQDFLDRYIKTSPCPHKQEALLLKSQIKRLSSLDGFKKKLEAAKFSPNSTFFNIAEGTPCQNPTFVYSKKAAQYIGQAMPHQMSSFFTTPTFTAAEVPPDRYILRLTNYHERVTELLNAEASLNTVRVSLTGIMTTAETAELIVLLQEILSHPLCLLYDKTLSLLSLLKDPEKLQRLVNHLPTQAAVARPDIPQPGSFDEVVPLNHQHDRCFDLLRNNSRSPTLDSEEGQYANSLLQTAIILYQSLYIPHEFDKRCCVIL